MQDSSGSILLRLIVGNAPNAGKLIEEYHAYNGGEIDEGKESEDLKRLLKKIGTVEVVLEIEGVDWWVQENKLPKLEVEFFDKLGRLLGTAPEDVNRLKAAIARESAPISRIEKMVGERGTGSSISLKERRRKFIFTGYQSKFGEEPSKIIETFSSSPEAGTWTGKQLGQLLMAYRLEAGLTQLELAKKIGAFTAEISFWENGKNIQNVTRYFGDRTVGGAVQQGLMSAIKVPTEQRAALENLVSIVPLSTPTRKKAIQNPWRKTDKPGHSM